MSSYLANILGALSLSVTDAVDAAVLGPARQGGQLVAALVLVALRPGMSIKQLAERLRLSHPGAVRLVDRLVEEGWVGRTPGSDRRSVRLNLTDAGQAEVDRLRKVRGERLAMLIGGLTLDERRVLEPIVEKLLRALTVDVVAAYANCRLCDTPVCEAHGCPVEAEARARFSPPMPTKPENADVPDRL